MSDIMENIEISDVDRDFVLSVGVDDKNGYFMPSLTFNKGMNDIYWDNEDYIFVRFRQFLKRWKDRELISDDKKEFKEIWDLLNKDSVDDLIEMIEQALKRGWYKPE